MGKCEPCPEGHISGEGSAYCFTVGEIDTTYDFILYSKDLYNVLRTFKTITTLLGTCTVEIYTSCKANT